MISVLPKKFKAIIRGYVKSARVAFIQKRFPFTKADLFSTLQRLGVQRGDVLLVHSSYDQFLGFEGSAHEVIQVLQEALGPEGTLLMPTLPFTGTAIEYVATGRVFDVRRSPSQVGLITELFRRSPGVRRSIHPTHSVAGWGLRAEEMLAEHHLSSTPCGRQSPYAKLLDAAGKTLLLGVDIDSMTLFHTIEEELESSMPFSPFSKEVFSLPCRDESGNIVFCSTRLFDPVYSKRRNLHKLVPVLQRQDAWREGRVGKLRVILLEAKEVLGAVWTLARQGVYCYESW